MATVIPRRAWRARPPRRASAPLRAQVVVVHHTTGPGDYARDAVPALLRAIQDLHMDGNGWDDIGYNLVVDRFGRAFAGRDGVGAHVLGHNHRALGIALLGDFTAALPAPAAVATLSALLPPGLEVVGHRDLADTECPGRALEALARVPQASGSLIARVSGARR